MTAYGADEAAVAGVLAASRALVAIATRSLGAGGGGDHDRPVPGAGGAGGAGVAGPPADDRPGRRAGGGPVHGGADVRPAGAQGPDPADRARTDRRSVHVSITAAGRRVVGEATARRRALVAETLARLPSPTQQVVAGALLSRVAAGEIPDSQWPADGQAVPAPGRPEPVRASADVRR